MNTHRIQVALKVAETRSISKAAAALFLTQPSVSNALSALESEIGFQIFERSNKGIKITPKGEEFLYSANIIADQLEHISHLANRSVYCRLHLTGLLSENIIHAFETFCENHKNASGMDVSFSCFSLSTDDGAKTLLENRADVVTALCREDQLPQVENLHGRFCEICVLSVQESYVVMSPKNPLVTQELTVENLKQNTIILYEDNRYAKYFLPVGDAEKLKFTKTIMVQSGELGRQLVQKDLGIMFCEDEHLPRMAQYGLICRPLGVRTALVCMYKKDKKNNPDILEFVKLLCNNFSGTP